MCKKYTSKDPKQNIRNICFYNILGDFYSHLFLQLATNTVNII